MKTGLREQITDYIRGFVSEYEKRDEIATKYGEPLVGFADAMHPYIQSLPQIISPTHDLPQNVLPDARTIIAYYIPFTEDLAGTNRIGSVLASPEWARAYEETNAMFVEMNEGIIDLIHAKAGQAGVTPKAITFNEERLISDWSQRHIAYAAGLGTFGVNHMLLTRKGCCGRFNSVITNLDITPDSPVEEEYCLYRKNGSCGVCMKNCPAGALAADDFDRFKCYEICMENAKVYTDFGSSYENEEGTGANSVGSDVCGKCITGSPCAFWNLE